jgi:hypothetical protein
MRRTRTTTALCGLVIVAAGLTAGGRQASAAPSLPANCVGYLSSVSCTFRYNGTTGADGTTQSFTVASGVRQVAIEAWGAQGGTLSDESSPFEPPTVGGLGGYAAGTFLVTPGAVLSINVGGQPTGTSGGFNGGGDAGPATSTYTDAGGGGATDVRSGGTDLTDRLIVAGGGGGVAENENLEHGGASGGAGGGSPGVWCAVSPLPGLSGMCATATSGGAAGTPASSCVTDGTSGLGGLGCGGAGGGGYFGGGGGGLSPNGGDGSSAVVGSGGGGSSFVGATVRVSMVGGMEPGNGLVRISYSTTRSFPGLRWSKPQRVEAKGPLEAVACADRTSCMAVDADGRAATYDGHWSKPKRVVTGSLAAVSCPTSAFCMAVGSVPDHATGGDPVIAIDRDGTWSSSTGPDLGATESLSGVSCVSATFCVAAGTYWEGGAPGTTAFVETFDGQSWTAIPDQELTGYASGDSMSGVSCASVSFCIAVGTAGDRGDVGGLVDVDVDGTWTGTQLYDDRTLGLGGGGLVAVACSAVNSCLAAGPGGYVWHDDGTGWTVDIADRMGDVTGLSCPEASRCVAVDDNGDMVNDQAGAWGPPLNVAAGLTGLSCSSTRFCISVGTDGDAVVGHS